ncbi:hypothetical protein KEJ39_00895 [Candidatus Bathyarchaeota archaeon]|nr:hypothetical protein [Candidatus Bathyarchaeota archaeon]
MPQRGGAISAASILFVIYGALGIIGSTFLLAASVAQPSIIGLPLIGALANVAAWILAAFGAILLPPSILALAAGYLLWKSRRSGGIFGIVIAAVTMAVLALLLLYPVLYVVGIIGIATSVILVVLISAGWRCLR